MGEAANWFLLAYLNRSSMTRLPTQCRPTSTAGIDPDLIPQFAIDQRRQSGEVTPVKR
jgi:hypothetical protein